ncbi:MAG: ABC-2 family transporter protein [Spirochaetales bacterium]|nr:ABC-2 family transporter protein [Spirochaetales bacterium]
MKVFKEIIRIMFKLLFQYKWTFAITAVTQPIALYIFMSLFKSIYEFNHTDFIKGYAFEQMVWYFISFLIINAFVWNSVTNSMSRKILSGELSSDLLKPLSVFKLELGASISSRLIAILMDFLPTMVICSFILFPGFITFSSALRFLSVIIPAFLINYLCAFLLGLLAMPLKDNSSITTISQLFGAFVGGAFIPLEFFSKEVNFILGLLPYKYIFYWPIQFFLNKPPADEWGLCLNIVIIQLIWVIALYCACRLLWKVVIKKYCAVGG